MGPKINGLNMAELVAKEVSRQLVLIKKSNEEQLVATMSRIASLEEEIALCLQNSNNSTFQSPILNLFPLEPAALMYVDIGRETGAPGPTADSAMAAQHLLLLCPTSMPRTRRRQRPMLKRRWTNRYRLNSRLTLHVRPQCKVQR